MGKTSIMAEFTLYSDTMSIAEMLSLLKGLSPDKSGDKDDVLKNGKSRGFSYWCIRTEREESLYSSIQVSKLVYRMQVMQDQIAKMIQSYGCQGQVGLVVSISNGEDPSIAFDTEILQFIAQLGISIDIDIYTNPYCE